MINFKVVLPFFSLLENIFFLHYKEVKTKSKGKYSVFGLLGRLGGKRFLVLIEGILSNLLSLQVKNILMLLFQKVQIKSEVS